MLSERNLRAIRQLREEVAVPFPAHIGVGIRESAHDSARQSPSGIEVIRVPLQSLVEGAAFDAEHRNVGVAAGSRGVLVFRMIFKRIVALAMGKGSIYEAPIPITVSGCQLVGSKRAQLVGSLELSAVGAMGLEINRGGGSIFRSRHQHLRLVGIEERNRFQGRERILSQIHRTVLCIGDAYPIQINAHMLRSERPHVHGFLSTQSAIVLDLHARHIFQRICHIIGRQVLQLLIVDGLMGSNLLHRLHHHLVQGLHRIGSKTLPIRYSICCHASPDAQQ